MQIHNLTSKEYYLYRRKSEKFYPWERNLINTDFLDFEKKLINNFRVWYDLFQKLKRGSFLPEITCFALPCILSKNHRLDTQNRGPYTPKILSVLNNCLQGNVLLLFPKENSPEEYSLVRIIKSKKEFIQYENLNYGRYAVVVEAYEVLSIDKLYLVDGFKGVDVEKFLHSTIIDDKHMISSLSAPIYGSPFVVGGGGGISLASIIKDSTFSQELLKTLQMIVPPGLRFALPPKTMFLGKKNFCFDGVSTKVAERYVKQNHVLSTVMGGSYDVINDELVKRNRFIGEYSIIGSINPFGKGEDLFQDIIRKFNNTEIVLPRLDPLKENYVDLTKVRKEIDESLWSQIAHLKQITPSFKLPTKRLHAKLKKDWEFILSNIGYKNSIEVQSVFNANPTLSNLIRLARSIARKKGQEKVSEDHFRSARSLFLGNIELMLKEINFEGIKEEIRRKKEDRKLMALQILLSQDPRDLKEIYKKIGKYFRDKRELDHLLKTLNQQGIIIKNQKQEYEWI